MKRKLVSIIIVAFSILVVLQAEVSANLANPNKPMRGNVFGTQQRIIDANIVPATVKPGGTITATGYVEWYCDTICNPPNWVRSYGQEVWLIQIVNGQDIIRSSCKTDPNGHFVLQCPTSGVPGTDQYKIMVPETSYSTGAYIGPWPITVSD